MSIIRTNNTASTTRTTASNHSGVQKRGTSTLGKVLSKICNTFQKLTGTSGQKDHSSPPAGKQPINEMKIIGVQTQKTPNKTEIKRPKEAPPAPPIRVPNSTASSSKVAKKPQVQRPKEAPPAPPTQNPGSTISASSPSVARQMIKRPTDAPPAPPVLDKTNASQQGLETSVQNGSEPVKPDVSINDIKMTPDELTKAWVAIALANASFEKQYRQQK